MDPLHQRAAAATTMRAIVLRRGAKTPSLVERPRPRPVEGEALLRTLLTGIDATDEELLSGEHGDFPADADTMVLGHECLAEVERAPEGSGLTAGDRVVPLVRHPCGECSPCARGRQDFCETGRYREHGIARLDGFLQEAWTDEPATLVKAPASLGDAAVLAEPLSVVVKALELAETAQRRVPGFDGWRDKRVLLAGAGSLGALGAFLLAERGARVWAMDRSPHDTTVARLLARIGVEHVNAKETPMLDVARECGGFDLVLESTGAPRVALDTVRALRRNGVSVLMGVPGEREPMPIEADDMTRRLVEGNRALLGSVNSSRAHVEEALAALGRFRARWGDAIDGVITHRYAPDEAVEAFRADGKDVIKKVVEWK